LGEYDHLDARVSTLMCVVAPELGIRWKNAERHSPIRMILIDHSKIAVDKSPLHLKSARWAIHAGSRHPHPDSPHCPLADAHQRGEEDMAFVLR